MSTLNQIEIPVRQINGQLLDDDQRTYLDGFFSGLAARGVRFSDIEPTPALAGSHPAQTPPPATAEDLTTEERIKRELHPLDAYSHLVENSIANQPPEKEDIFRFKWNGLFYLSPIKDGFMARLRIPGGYLKTFQLRELAAIAKQLTTGYVQITTRANLQMRLIEPKDCPEVLRRIQSVGLHTRGAGADNIRNITANPTAGIDPHELIDVMPFCNDLAQIIINDRAFYNLPRKFNVAFDGGGLIGTLEDTNDIGAKAVKIGDQVCFRIALGGATGHKTFARDLGVLVKPSELIKVIVALIQVFIAHGNRTDRKKARLKHLLETWSLEKYLAETEKLLGWQLQRADPATVYSSVQDNNIPHSHVGVHAQKQTGLNYIGVAIPVGQITPRQMLRVAEIADLYGSGEVRLTVWQNLIIPNVADAYVETATRALRKIGFETQPSMLRSGWVACTGNSYCKFAQTNTKAHAIELADYLEKKIELDSPINIHLTGCPNSCAQHYIGDIGLLGTKVRGGEGYHVFVGGGFGANQSVGRQIFTGLSINDLKPTLEKMLKGYLRRRSTGETFQAFTTRHDLNTLQAIFSNEE
jgi:ferredoxin-nitrite reductase